ncbi:DUF721 domain-containing protein [bacterium]|nr:DUF721 domain-containing protein [bacterium]
MCKGVALSGLTKKAPTPLGRSVWRLIRSLGLEKKVKQNEVLIKWSEIVGEQVFQVTRVDRVQNGILFVKVSSSAWRNELIYMKKEILEKIYSSIGKGVIEDIRFI